MMGLHSGVSTSDLSMDGVVIVDLECNHIMTTEEIPSIPEPELSFLRGEIMKLSYPNIVDIDRLDSGHWRMWRSSYQYSKCGVRPWGEEHDLQLRLIFLRFFASILSGYRNFIINKFLGSQGFVDYLERGMGHEENTKNLLHKLQDAIGRGQDLLSILPPPHLEHEFVIVLASGAGILGSDVKYTYDRFPSNTRTQEQELKRKQILQLRSPSFIIRPETPPNPRVDLEIKVKLQGLWLHLLKPDTTDDLLSSSEYGTILVLIEFDAEGIGGGGFIECIREHINTGWTCELTEGQFIAIKELLWTTISHASSRNDMSTIRGALKVSAEMYRKDVNNVFDYVQGHLIFLSIWEDLRFWEEYFDYLVEKSSHGSINHADQVMTQLMVVATHLVGLGFSEIDAWTVIETIAEENNLRAEQYVKLRGYLSHIQQLRVNYWGVSNFKAQFPLPQSPRLQDPVNDTGITEAPGVGTSWIKNLFRWDPSSKVKPSTRVRPNSDSGDKYKMGPQKQDSSNTGQKKIQTNVRLLKGHFGAVTALHCITEREVWDLSGDCEDAGFFISGSTDCLVI